MEKTKGDYFNLGWVASLILAIIPLTSAVCGIITRFKEGKIVAGILRIVLGWNVIYFLDLFYVIFTRKICRLLPF